MIWQFHLSFFPDQFLILEVLKQPWFDDIKVDSKCPTICDTYIIFVSMHCRPEILKKKKGITLALWKSFYVMLERIVEIYIIYIGEWNKSNCIKEQKICQIFCTYYLLSDWTIHPLMEFCTVYYASFLCSKRRYH